MPLGQFIEAIVELSREYSNRAENAFLEAGAVSVTLQDGADQPILEPGVGETPLWDKCILKALFAADIDTDSIAAMIINSLPFPISLHWELLEDKDWSQEWKKHFKPISCSTGRLWICPSWLDAPHPDAVNLRLDPGLAFGTGSHATTMLCLNWLEKQSLKGRVVIDYGCGSGILGIAALLLGADKVYAVDNDPQALLASRDNARRNNIADSKLITCFPDAMPSEAVAEITVANILAAPLIQLAEKLSALTKTGGSICLSGLLEQQIDDVCAPYLEYFDFDPTTIEGQWAQLSACKVR